MIIYKATNKKNNKIYIGLTKHPLNKRKSQHKIKAKVYFKQEKTNIHFYNAINKYGFSNFDWEIIDTALILEELKDKEVYHIAITSAYICDDIGYNMTSGGDGGDTFTNNPNKEEIRKRMSKASKGRKHTPETLKKISKANKGKKLKEKTKKKISIANKKVIHTKEWNKRVSESNKGRIFTKKHRGNISKGKIGTPLTDVHKNNIKKSYTEERIKVNRLQKTCRPIEIDGVWYQSINDACRQLNIPSTTMYNRLKNKKFPNYKYV